MIKLVKRMLLWLVFVAVSSMTVRIIIDLCLLMLTSNIINNGATRGDTGYAWNIGVAMLGSSLVSTVASTGNTFFTTKES